MNIEKQFNQRNDNEEEIAVLHVGEGTPALRIPGSSSLEKLCEQLNRVENKLDQALASLQQHDTALKALKHNVADLRNDIQDSTTQRTTADTLSDDHQTKRVKLERQSPKRKRGCLVTFPVANDSYLRHLEESIETDEELREELMERFDDAPKSCVYEYLRKNIQYLLINTSKYTWTGRPSNTGNTATPSNPACELKIVELLITCCLRKFPKTNRQFAEKEFRRGLQNFNESMVTRAKRRQEKIVQKNTIK